MASPKKLVRTKMTRYFGPNEWEVIESQSELNELYALKIKEELAEVQEANHKDITEFADLIQVAVRFALENGFSMEQLEEAMSEKSGEKGDFGRIALTRLNPNNPSNDIYFDN